ncbi:MAG TPA: bifunctional riboflavin kinase/FAD synthetase [Rhodanobacteraceae bacterium]|nr:bifunctional riboflavin kinase/FAD synthetase [Rhodanobacteraceae bacterium]
MIEVYRDVAGPCLAPAGSVAAVGAFDGLHCGHQALLARVRERAARLGLMPVAISFEPLPRQYFSSTPVPRLSSVAEKLAGLAAAGIERVLLLRFNAALTAMSAEDFIARILAERAGVRELWVGESFRFGHQRRGDTAMLERLGPAHGLGTEVLAPVEIAAERVSSSRIRQMLAAGRFDEACAPLGRRFSIAGHVAYGAQLGRSLGFPTANIHLGRRVSPVQGIFAVRIGINDGPCAWPGVASLGTRPTVNGHEPLLEFHLFDFEGDLYGRRIAVEFVAKLRDEEKFANLDQLTAQMHQDARDAREVLGMSPALAT